MRKYITPTIIHIGIDEQVCAIGMSRYTQPTVEEGSEILQNYDTKDAQPQIFDAPKNLSPNVNNNQTSPF